MSKKRILSFVIAAVAGALILIRLVVHSSHPHTDIRGLAVSENRPPIESEIPSTAASPAAKTKHKAAKAMSDTTVVTGCLQKSDETGEFSITGEDGKTWGLGSSSVKLDQHLGHEVTVTGSTIHESAKTEKAEEKREGQVENAGSKAEYADLNVTSLRMVSETCSK